MSHPLHVRRGEVGPPLWIRWGVAFFALVCAFVLGEGVLRVWYGFGERHEIEFTRYSLSFKQPGPGPDLPFEHRPNMAAPLMGVTVRTNAEGLRAGPLSRTKPPATFRVACVGDSLTFGWGVAEEDTYCNRLAERLRARPVAPRFSGVEGLNFGVGNYNTVMELAVLRRKVFAYQPDLVVLQYYINDAEPVPRDSGRPLLAYSYLAVFLWARVDLLLRHTGVRRDYVRHYRDLYADGQAGLPPFHEAIRSFARECREHRVPLVVVIFPELHRLDAGEPFQDIYARVGQWWDAEGVPVVDLWSELRGRDAREFWVHPADVHPNARAQAVAADALERLLSRIPETWSGGR